MHTQRRLLRNGELSDERIQLLNKIGFDWGKALTPWMDQYNELVAFKNKHGHTLVRQRSGQLGNWVQTQRKARRKDELSGEQIELLDEIGFVWNVYTEQWMDRYYELKAYKKEHGDTLVRQRSGQLGIWVDTQRQARRRGELSEEQIALLNEIGFVWNVRAEQWNINLNKLKAFKNKHGHTNVSKEHDRKLYQWCRSSEIRQPSSMMKARASWIPIRERSCRRLGLSSTRENVARKLVALSSSSFIFLPWLLKTLDSISSLWTKLI